MAKVTALRGTKKHLTDQKLKARDVIFDAQAIVRIAGAAVGSGNIDSDDYEHTLVRVMEVVDSLLEHAANLVDNVEAPQSAVAP